MEDVQHCLTSLAKTSPRPTAMSCKSRGLVTDDMLSLGVAAADDWADFEMAISVPDIKDTTTASLKGEGRKL